MAQLKSGEVNNLHALYGGLPSGRLIITGAPGAGKSGAAVLLILAALRYRDEVPATDRTKIPVPVLLNAQNWDPNRDPITNWLARQLKTLYPQLPGLADAATVGTLMTEGQIALIVDGLDEIAAKLQPVALRALSRQVSCRIVILGRAAEMASAAVQQGMVQGAAAIELKPVSPAEAVSYLERMQLDPLPKGWRDLIRHLRDKPAGPLSKALDNPLALSLVRDVCQTEDDAVELLTFSRTIHGESGAKAITDYLLDRFLIVAYTHLPGQPPLPYDLPTAGNALTKIAVQMNREGTRDLYWWHITGWAPRTQRRITSGLLVGLAGGLVIGLSTGLWMGPTAGLKFGLWGGLSIGLVVGRNTVRDGKPPRTNLQFGKFLNRKNLLYGVTGGLAVGLTVGLAFGLAGGLALGLAFAIALVLAGAFDSATTVDPDSSSPQSPGTSWRYNWNYVTLAMLAFGLAGGLTLGLAFGLAGRLAYGSTVGLAGGLAFGLAIGACTSEAWPTFLASAQLASKWHTPVRLMTFLEDAHKRNVLRTAGPAYQFRHDRLQQRLAARAGSGTDRASLTPNIEPAKLVKPQE